MCSISPFLRFSSTCWFTVAVGTGIALAFVFYYSGYLDHHIDRFQRRRRRRQPFVHSDQFALPKTSRIILKDRVWLTHDTCLLAFEFPEGADVIDLPLGNHVMISDTVEFDDDDKSTKKVARSYTPVSRNDDPIFQLVVKVYRPETPRFPKGGIMSQHLANVALPHEFQIRGPLGRLTYIARGLVRLKRGPGAIPAFEDFRVARLCMIAGGSGITPMFQLLQHILENKDDYTKINLLFANKTKNDIILKQRLMQFAQQMPEKFYFWNIIAEQDDDLPPNSSTGLINKKLIAKHLDLDETGKCNDALVLVCGPEPMIKLACLPALDELEVPKSRIHLF